MQHYVLYLFCTLNFGVFTIDCLLHHYCHFSLLVFSCEVFGVFTIDCLLHHYCHFSLLVFSCEVLRRVNNKYCYAYSVLNNQSQYHNMNFTMFVTQMGQPNFDSEPFHRICKIPYRTDSERFIDIPFRTVPNFQSQFCRPLIKFIFFF